MVELFPVGYINRALFEPFLEADVGVLLEDLQQQHVRSLEIGKYPYQFIKIPDGCRVPPLRLLKQRYKISAVHFKKSVSYQVTNALLKISSRRSSMIDSDSSASTELKSRLLL